MRKLLATLKARILVWLGQPSHRLEIGIQTRFRGRKNHLQLPVWQEIAELFRRTPDLEDFLQLQVEGIEKALRGVPITSDGDRQRLVLHAQVEVLQDMLSLPTKAAAKVREMLLPKNVSLKGYANV